MSRVGGVRGTYSTPGPYSSDRDLLSPGWKSWTEGKSSVWVAAQVRNLRTTSPSISGMERSFTIWFASQRGPVTRGPDPSRYGLSTSYDDAGVVADDVHVSSPLGQTGKKAAPCHLRTDYREADRRGSIVAADDDLEVRATGTLIMLVPLPPLLHDGVLPGCICAVRAHDTRRGASHARRIAAVWAGQNIFCFSGGLKLRKNKSTNALRSGPLIDPKDDCLANESL